MKGGGAGRKGGSAYEKEGYSIEDSSDAESRSSVDSIAILGGFGYLTFGVRYWIYSVVVTL